MPFFFKQWGGVNKKRTGRELEGHTWNDLRHQLSKANAELEWFDKYALGKAYTYERPPQP